MDLPLWYKLVGVVSPDVLVVVDRPDIDVYDHSLWYIHVLDSTGVVTLTIHGSEKKHDPVKNNTLFNS
jgi:hypothetical protein